MDIIFVSRANVSGTVPLILLTFKPLREGVRRWERGERRTRVNGANERAACGGREQAARRAQREDEARGGEDAQHAKLRQQADRVWNGAADLVVRQVPTNVRAEGVRRGESTGERTTPVKGHELSAGRGGREQAAGRRSARTRRGRRRGTHNWLSSVIWPTSIGMVPLIFRLYNSLRVCAAL